MYIYIYWLVVEQSPLKTMSSSIGMMTFPVEWGNKSHVPNHPPESLMITSITSCSIVHPVEIMASNPILHAEII